MPVNGRVRVEPRPDLIQSAHDNLFTSGTLGRYSKMLNSVIEKRLSYRMPMKRTYVRNDTWNLLRHQPHQDSRSSRSSS